MRLRDTLPGSVQGLLTHLKRAARSTGRGGQKDCPELVAGESRIRHLSLAWLRSRDRTVQTDVAA